jgi:hypothetical protein
MKLKDCKFYAIMPHGSATLISQHKDFVLCEDSLEEKIDGQLYYYGYLNVENSQLSNSQHFFPLHGDTIKLHVFQHNGMKAYGDGKE